MAQKRAQVVKIAGVSVPVIHAERVQRALAEQLEVGELSRLSALFKAFADETRLRILLALRGGEMCVYDLAACVGLTESAVSHQLRRFRELALVRCRRDGQACYYSLIDDHVVTLLDMGLEHVRE